jgi:hypothetical protein
MDPEKILNELFDSIKEKIYDTIENIQSILVLYLFKINEYFVFK